MMVALQEGEPSAAVLGDVRFKLARMYLADSRLSSAEIALLLGYSEQSAFTRAFRTWSGSTPLDYRRRLQRSSPSSR